MILSAMVTTNFMPYIAVFVSYLVDKCKGRKRSLKNYQFERKYA